MTNENQKDSQTIQRPEASPSQAARPATALGPGWLPLFTPFTLMRRRIDDIDRLTQAGGARDAEPGRLVLSGERSQDVEQKGTNFIRSERRYGSFRRVVLLPDGADAEQSTATFHDGVLEITIPAPRLKASHRIEIQSGTNTRLESDTGQNTAAPAA
jgi:hypothetical protein